MKKIKSLEQISYICVLSFILILPSFSFAANWTGAGIISTIGIYDGSVLVGGDLDSDNTDACGKSLPLFLPPEKPGYSELYALLVASYLQNKPVNIYISGCIEIFGNTYPKISLVNSYHSLK